MVSITRCCRRLRASLLLLLLSLCVGAPPGFAFGAADPSIDVRSAEIALGSDGYDLDAVFQIELGHTLEDALAKGVALNFVTEFEMVYERWYLLNLWNRTVSGFDQRFRLTYNALTRQYRVAAGALAQNVDTLQEALAVMGHVRGRFVAARDDLEAGTAYSAQIRMRLDTSQLPKPFQINAIGSRGWNLASDWYRWTVKP